MVVTGPRPNCKSEVNDQMSRNLSAFGNRQVFCRAPLEGSDKTLVSNLQEKICDQVKCYMLMLVLQVNIIITRSLGSNKSNRAISESCNTGQKRSYNDQKLS